MSERCRNSSHGTVFSCCASRAHVLAVSVPGPVVRDRPRAWPLSRQSASYAATARIEPRGSPVSCSWRWFRGHFSSDRARPRPLMRRLVSAPGCVSANSTAPPWLAPFLASSLPALFVVLLPRGFTCPTRPLSSFDIFRLPPPCRLQCTRTCRAFHTSVLSSP